MKRMRFAVRVSGEWTPDLAERFADVAVGADGAEVTLTGELDQAGLHGLLERIRVAGLELVDVRRTRSTHSR